MQAVIEELVEEDRRPAVRLTGRFRCVLENGAEAEFGTLSHAIGWARERASRVELEFERGFYDVTRHPPPPAVLDRAALGPRRRAGEEWLDRTPQDAPIEWTVEVHVHPKDLHGSGPERERQDLVAALAVRALREAGFAGVSISAQELDAGLADIDEQGQGQDGDYGWTTSHPLAYEITATATGSTRDEVVERAVQVAAGALERELGEEVWRHTTDEHGAWGVSADARPAGTEPLRRGLW